MRVIVTYKSDIPYESVILLLLNTLLCLFQHLASLPMSQRTMIVTLRSPQSGGMQPAELTIIWCTQWEVKDTHPTAAPQTLGAVSQIYSVVRATTLQLSQRMVVADLSPVNPTPYLQVLRMNMGQYLQPLFNFFFETCFCEFVFPSYYSPYLKD